MKKNKYIKIFTLLLLFSFIVSDTMSVFYSKSYVLSAEIDDDIKTQEESGKTEESDQNIQNNKQSDKKEQKEEIVTSGSFNSGLVNWRYSDGILYFIGNGDIPAFDITHKTLPWASYAEKVSEISFSKGITGVGNYAFDSCNSLMKVTATEDLDDIGFFSFPKKNDLTFFAPYDSCVLNFAKENAYRYSATTSKKYTVYFNTLMSETFEPKTVVAGDFYGELPTPYVKGYKFVGWYTKSVGGINITASSKVDIKSDIYLYARWEKQQKKQYKVNFNTLTSETFEPKTVVSGEYYGQLPTPFAKGYNFLGWYTNAVGGINITSYSKVELDSDIYLYARWEKKQYKVEFRDDYSNNVFPTDKVVYEGEEFGTLPQPRREGYRFLGWFAYNDTYKDYQITETTKCYSYYTYQTSVLLFAKWERAQYIITFDTAGGIIEGVGGINIKTVYYGMAYGILPVPVREGYEFKGWFTSGEGGEPITYDTLVPELPAYYQTLYAHWEKIKVEEHIVTFDPNGGYLNENEINKTVAFGKEYGVLPIPSRKGYSFNGWFTKRKGGKKIYGNDIFNSHSDIILYAGWTNSAKTVYKAKLLKKLSYKFENSHEGFSYNYGYKIPLVCFQFMFGKTELASLLYKYDGYWGGNCYGMATTSGMFYSKNIIKPSIFKKGAKTPSDLKLSYKNTKQNINLRRFIELMQISQYYSSVQNVYNKNANKISKIVKEVKKFQNSGKNPVVIAISGRSGAHAVVGYSVEDYKDGTSRLYVYDPNFPNAKRYITLSRNYLGDYTGWYYLMSNTYNWGSDYGGIITYVPSKEYSNIWKQHSNKKIVSNILFTDTDNITIYDEDKKIAAVLKDGKLISENSKIKKMWDFKVHKDTNIKISLPDGVYTVENTGKKQNFTIAMAGTSEGAEVTTLSDKVTIAIDESRKICEVKPLNEDSILQVFAFISNGVKNYLSYRTMQNKRSVPIT